MPYLEEVETIHYIHKSSLAQLKTISNSTTSFDSIVHIEIFIYRFECNINHVNFNKSTIDPPPNHLNAIETFTIHYLDIHRLINYVQCSSTLHSH